MVRLLAVAALSSAPENAGEDTDEITGVGSFAAVSLGCLETKAGRGEEPSHVDYRM